MSDKHDRIQRAVYTPEVVAAIPQAMRDVPRWLCWRLEKRKDKQGRQKWTKAPIHGATGTDYASSTDPNTWRTFAQALATFEGHKRLHGLGFVLGDGWAGIDLDHMLDGTTLHPWAQDLVDRLGTYGEISPSGTGVKLFARVDSPIAHCGKRTNYPEPGLDVEVYDSGRYFTVSGERLGPAEVTDCTEQLRNLLHELFPPKQKATAGAPQRPLRPIGDNDDDVLGRARAGPKGADFEALWRGDTAGHGGDSNRADLALCGSLAFWSGGDRGQVDRLFRLSGLYREKWDRADYRERTLDKAFERRDFWQPPERRHGLPPGAIESLPREPHRYHRTELGNAEMLVDLFGEDIRYCHTGSAWWWWCGCRWQQDTQGHVLHLANLVARARQAAVQDLPDEEEDEKKAKEAERKWAFGSESRSKRDSTLAQAMSIPGMGLRYEDLDTNPWILGCENGTLDLRTGQLRPHAREDFCSQLVPVAYDANAPCPKWDAFLAKVMGGSEAMVGFLQRAIGYSLSGSTREQVLFILWGSGRNGKSVLLETLLRLLGSYAQATSPATFLVSQSETVRNDLARLRGARFVKAVETSEGRRLDEGLIKQVTGCDRMPARFLFQEYFEFDPQLKLWLATNHKPEIRGQDLGIWRRIRLIPFTVVISDEEDDKDLQAALLEELPGILAWAVRGFADWWKRGLAEPEEVLLATQDYRSEQDVLGKFFDDCCILKPGLKAGNGELYAAYRDWAKHAEEYCQSQTKFSTMLKARGYQQHRTAAHRQWMGIGMKAESPQETSPEHPDPAPQSTVFGRCDEWGIPVELF